MGGGRKLALQNGKVEGRVGKNTALFLEAVKETSRWLLLREREREKREMRERGERDERERRKR